jgi:hypothetical protein
MHLFRRACVALALLSAIADARAAQLHIESAHVDFGSSVLFATLEHTYTIRNGGSRPVSIVRWLSVSGIGEVVGLPSALQPGQSAEFQVRVPIGGQQGQQTRRFALFTDEADVDRYRFSLSGFAYSLIEPERAVLDFKDVHRGRAESLSIELSARESEPLRLLGVAQQPDWVRTTLDGNRVTVTVGESMPSGPHGAQVLLKTNLAQQPLVEVGVVALGRGGLEASEYFLVFPPAPAGKRLQREIELRHPTADLARDLRFDLGPGWDHRETTCAPASRGCRRVMLTRTLDFQGRRLGELTFSVGKDESLRVKYSLMSMTKGQVVREVVIDSAGEGSGTLQQTLDAVSRGDAPATKAPPSVGRTAPTSSRGPAPVRLRWRARSLGETFGFLVYRSSSRAGPFVRVSGPIRAQPDGGFEFVDASVEVGSTYHYYVDSLSSTGRKERFSPVMSKTITAD